MDEETCFSANKRRGRMRQTWINFVGVALGAMLMLTVAFCVAGNIGAGGACAIVAWIMLGEFERACQSER